MPSGRRGRWARWSIFALALLLSCPLTFPSMGARLAASPESPVHLWLAGNASTPAPPGNGNAATGGGGPLPSSVIARFGTFDPAVPRPTGWAPGQPPPGAPVDPGTVLHPSSPRLGTIQPKWNNSVCAGLWPQVWGKGGGQSLYAPGCYGHDEPAIEFYSNLPGSGGNVSWNVTLPIDRSPTMEQADLYVAIWFGLTLSDPYSWLHQCFLELQFYPDSTYSGGTGYDQWVAAAVAWQIEASNGYENPCFYAPLYLGGSGGSTYFNMAGGDALSVRFEGWAGDPTGESIAIDDRTSGNTSSLDLFNSTANLPLDPAFAENDVDNSLLWTPGGEFPVSFAFETGHAAAGGYPENSSYGGCSPGIPPSTRQDPAVPCPSYDPGSWVNDSLAPWRISAPTFFNATASMQPAQVGFGQPEGGQLAIDGFSNASCAGRDGSAWCSYPWYSYVCEDHVFEFGAADYPGTSSDFGKFLQFGYNDTTNGLGLGYYAPTNFSIPTCGAPSYSLGIRADPGGLLNFLSAPFPPNGTVPGLGAGWYSLSAVPASGLGFLGWTVGGGVKLGTPATDPWAAIDLLGNGTVAARFGPVDSNTTIDFHVAKATGGPAALLEELAGAGARPAPAANLTNGTSATLPTGIYWLEAHAPVDQTFLSWSVGPGLLVLSSRSPFTWLIVTGSGSQANLTAAFAPFSASANVYGFVAGATGGQLTFDGASTTGSNEKSLSTGTWRFLAQADRGYVFAGWYVGGDGESDDVGPIANVTVEGASVYVYAYFRLALRISIPNGTGGAVEIGGYGRSGNGSIAELTAGTYAVADLPPSGYAFERWASANASALWVESPNSATTDIELNSSATLELDLLAVSKRTSLTFGIVPSGAGSILFDGESSEGPGAVNATLADASQWFPIAAIAHPGYAFVRWATNGSLTLGNSSLGAEVFVNVSGTLSFLLTAEFSPYRVPVSFAASGVIGTSATINGTRLTEDETVLLPPGTYPLAVRLADPNSTFAGWQATGGLGIAAGALTVAGPGTVYALVAPFGIAAPTASPALVRLNGSLTLSVTVNGSGPFAYRWQGLPGCTGAAARSTCRPDVTGSFDASVVVTDPLGDVAVSAGVRVAVDDGALRALTRVSPNATDVGHIVLLSVSAEDGFAPYTYHYTRLPAGCPSFDAPSISCLAAPAPDLAVTVTDRVGLNATFPIALLVNPLPALSVTSPGAWSVDQGVATTLDVSLRGGTAPFSADWSGLPPGCISANRTRVTCTPAANGSFLVSVSVTDAVGETATVSDTLFAYPDPVLALTVPAIVRTDAGEAVTLSVSPSGGSAPYSIEYAGLPPSCPSANLTTIGCTPAGSGMFPYQVNVTDRDGLRAEVNGTLNVTPDPTISSFSLSARSLGWGSPLTVQVVVAGGQPRFAFRFSGLPGCVASIESSFTCLPNTPGSYTLVVNATDSVGLSAVASANLTVRPPPPAGGIPWVEVGGGIALLGAVALLGVLYGQRRRARAEGRPKRGARARP